MEIDVFEHTSSFHKYVYFISRLSSRRGERARLQVFSTFPRDTQRGHRRGRTLSPSQEAVYRAHSLHTGFSKETALSARIGAFASTSLYRGRVCGRGPYLNALPNVCAHSVCCGLFYDEFLYMQIRRQSKGRGYKRRAFVAEAPRENSSFLLLRNRFRFLQFDRSSQIELSIKEILVRLSKERKRVETKRV